MREKYNADHVTNYFWNEFINFNELACKKDWNNTLEKCVCDSLFRYTISCSQYERTYVRRFSNIYSCVFKCYSLQRNICTLDFEKATSFFSMVRSNYCHDWFSIDFIRNKKRRKRCLLWNLAHISWFNDTFIYVYNV